MNKQNARFVWIVPVLLAIATLACSGGSAPEATATPLPRPTQKPNATATTAPARPTATRAPAKATATKAAAAATDVPTDVPSDTTPEAPFTLASQPYTHKSGAFTITLPDGWQVDEQDNSVFVTSPDNVASIEVLFTNVGATFDADTLNTYIKAKEDNWFGTFANYTAKPNEPQKDGSILVYKTLDLSDGTPETVFSYYWQDGTVIYEQNFWTDTSVYDQYADSLVQVANTMTVDSAAGAKADPYAIVYQFTDPSNLYQFEVPFGWTHTDTPDNTSGVKTDVETFTSPDQFSYIENIEYDNGTAISKTDAGAFALALLKQYYEVTDLKVTDDSPQSDGSERLTWNSAAKNIDGESFFETRGTPFLLLTWVVDSDHYDLFKPVWNTLVGSYQVPEP